MINQPRVLWVAVGALWAWGFTGAAAMADGQAPDAGPVQTVATAPAATAPASRPAASIILVRLGDNDKNAITQEEFNSYFYGGPPVDFEKGKEQLIRELVERKWLSLYLDDHPEIDVEPLIKAQTDRIKAKEKIATDEEFEAFLLKLNMTPEIWRRQWRLLTAKAKLQEIGNKKASDEAALKKMFEDRPMDFDGTLLAVRHILIGVAAYDTPREKQSKKEKAEKIREDLVGGKITWEAAVKESTDASSKAINGNLGSYSRHEGLMEELADAAFHLELNKPSEVIETPFGYHIIEVFRMDAGSRSFEEAKPAMKAWLQREPIVAAVHEAKSKYPTVGVQPPLQPTRPPWRAATSQPGGRRLPLGQLSTRPSVRKPAARPAGAQTRPAK